MRKKAVCFPKIRISRLIWSNIRKSQYMNELTDEQLAQALEVSVRTLNNYDNEPCKLSLETIEMFVKNTETPFEQLIAI